MKNILLCFLLWVSIPATCSEHKVQDIVITIPTHTDSTQTTPVHHRHKKCSTKMKVAVISSGTTIVTALLIILLKFYL